jgi:MEMO1 family protein
MMGFVHCAPPGSIPANIGQPCRMSVAIVDSSRYGFLRIQAISWKSSRMVTAFDETQDRPAYCAGRFYPDDATELRRAVDHYIADGRTSGSEETPKGVIAPHAGYVFSGPIAGSAYRAISPEVVAKTRRVLLIGPSHFIRFEGVAIAPHRGFQTPLGRVQVDEAARASLDSLSFVHAAEAPHQGEHSLEVHVPFVQRVFGDVTLIPLVVGDASPEEIGAIFDACGRDDETFWVISSDLSHFEPQQSATLHDNATADKIESLLGDEIGPYDACGYQSIRGLLTDCQRFDRRVQRVDLRTSADTSGDPQRVVGYGAWTFG